MKKNVLENYPIIDGHRKHYVLHPIKKKNGKWVAVEVLLPNGYIDPTNNPAKTEFNKEADCQKTCDIHNSFHGWSKDAANTIIAKSMGILN